MAEKQTRRTGKKTRKYGRQKNSPAHQRYNNEERWEKNKICKAQKTANKFGKAVKIKIKGNWEIIKSDKKDQKRY